MVSEEAMKWVPGINPQNHQEVTEFDVGILQRALHSVHELHHCLKTD
jgi:hypothetical protein